MDFITSSLAVGSLADANDAPLRAQYGIDAVLSLLPTEPLAVTRHAVVAVADRTPLPGAAIEAALAFLAGEIRAGRRVLVHCQMGISRSPAIAAAYLHAHQGVPLAQAIELVRARYPAAEPHPVLIASLFTHFTPARADGSLTDLSANENPLGASPNVARALTDATAQVHRYPARDPQTLRSALASRFTLDRMQVVLGNGSCEVLDLVARACLAPGDEALIPVPSFLPYQAAVHRAHGSVRKIALPTCRNGVIDDLAYIAAAVGPRTRLVILGHPNNPTGSVLGEAALRALVAALPPTVTLLIDEAYAEYREDEEHDGEATDTLAADPLSWLHMGKPVVVVRTFSKIYGLAGLRIGYALAPRALAQRLDALRPHYNTSSLAQAGALAALADDAHRKATCAANRSGRQALTAGLRALGIAVAPSAANFVLAHTGQATRWAERLAALGVLVKSGEPFGLPEHLRISIGSPQDNLRCLAAIAAIAVQDATF